MAFLERINSRQTLFADYNRVTILEEIEKRGSATTAQLKKHFGGGIAYGTLQYHLLVLERSGVVERPHTGRERPYTISKGFRYGSGRTS